MDKMREDFEAWVTRYRPGSRVEMDAEFPDEYLYAETQYAWEGWQASRAALCVELSDLEFSTDRSGDGGIMLSERVFDAMKKAGVPYK